MRSRNYYEKEYINKERSIHDIAKEHKTYPNKIRRELKTYGFELRDKSAAQKAALKSGRHKHPTRGKRRPMEVRLKIAVSVSETKNAKNKEK